MSSLARYPENSKIIERDLGGALKDRYEEIHKLKAEGTRIYVTGHCASSCTLLLGLDQACVEPGARLGFHGPYTRIGIPLPYAAFIEQTEKMASYYPPALAEWFLAEGRLKIYDNITWFSGEQVAELGVKLCWR